jgi:hypothetical protein
LPIDYLYTEVDRFEVIPDSIDCDEFNPLGTQYKVSVRSYERLDTTYLLHNLQQWRSNWDRTTISLKTVPSLESFENLTTMNSCNWKKLAVDLKEKLGIKITCVPPESERKNLFKAILKSAIPIAVWLRKEIRECDREPELNRLLTIGNLEKLPEYIRKEREEAYVCDKPDEHFGNHLVLLWEDPNRLTPDVMAQLLPTGQ